VVVDGSNLATEGRNLPSLAQLDEAVRAFADERPDDEIIVVVDASFGYRIDESERKVFEEAEDAGEIVSPPAGAIGRGDGFLLRIADRIDADVLSNDSFQEFHGEYLWLFDEGRLIGGKPVPGVGWIFTPRTPVRGPKSRVATRDADRARKRVASASVAAVRPPRPGPTVEAIAQATAEAIAPDAPVPAKRGSRRRSRATVADAPPPEAINEPLPFITFIAEHPLGTEVEGTVDSFTSHGAFVTADGARCYAPVSGLGDPPPRSAKEVLKRGDVHTFVIQALDPPRRGIELALPGLAKIAGAPTDETVEAEIDAGSHAEQVDAEPAGAGPVAGDGAARPRRRRAAAGATAASPSVAEAGAPSEPPVEHEPAEPETSRPARARRGRSATAAAAALPEPAVESPVEPASEASPARARRRRPGAAAALETVAAPAPVPDAPLPAAAAVPARPRRSPARVAAEATPAPPASPTRSARRRSAPAIDVAPPAAVAAAAPVEAVEAPVAGEAPAKKATRARKKAAPAPAPPPVDASPPAPVRKRAAKKVATSTGAEDPPPAPAEKPVKKARKAAAKAATPVPDEAVAAVAKKAPARKAGAPKAAKKAPKKASPAGG
jgi:hypothetical protein